MRIPDGAEVVYIDRVETDDPSIVLRATSKVGQRNAAHSCAVGKALLAELSEEKLDELLAAMTFVQKTENTITDPLQLKDHLRVVHARGYSVDDEESEKGIRCVAAPIRDELGRAVAAISISGPTVRVSRQRIEDALKDDVMQTALEISRRLGFRDK